MQVFIQDEKSDDVVDTNSKGKDVSCSDVKEKLDKEDSSLNDSKMNDSNTVNDQ